MEEVSEQKEIVRPKGANVNPKAVRNAPNSQNIQNRNHRNRCSLYDRAIERQKRHEAAIAGEREASRLAAKPAISHRSRVLANALGPSKERLASQGKKSQAFDRNNSQRRRMSSQNSDVRSDSNRNTANEIPRYEKLYREHEMRLSKRNQISEITRKSLFEKELDDCTFKPKITPYASHREWNSKGQDDVALRLAQWEHLRLQRLVAQREMIKEEPLDKECTFKPVINPQQVRKSDSQSLNSFHGVQTHLNRHKLAREEKERRLSAAEGSAAGTWNGMPTIPKEPHFHLNERYPRKSEPEALSKINRYNS